jgi:hypothetical protein
MSFLNRLAARFVKRGIAELEVNERSYAGAYPSDAKSSGSSEGDFGDGLNVKLYNAVGGKIVRFSTYNRVKGQDSSTTYLIGSDENFAESFTKLMTAESLKNG